VSIPLCIDLYCGLGGWAHGFLAEGYWVVGFDIERRPYPGLLVLQDVLTLHGSQFRDAAVIVASPPCQNYSYMAMPWQRAKAIAAEIRVDGTGAKLRNLNALFDACFRIQREASAAAGHHIPMVVENVKGAQPWVGRAAWHYGSYYLWGDVPALMPVVMRAQKFNPDGTGHPQGSWFKVADSVNRRSGRKVPMNVHEHEKTGKPGRSFQSVAVDHTKNNGGSWFAVGSPGQKELGHNPVHDGLKNGNDWFGSGENCSLQHSRKAASALIAKIPFPLAQHIARICHPGQKEKRAGREETVGFVPASCSR